MARSFPKPLVEEAFTKKEKKGKKAKAPPPRKKRIPKIPHRFERGLRKVVKLIKLYKEMNIEAPSYLFRKLAELQQAMERRKAKLYVSYRV